MATKNDEGKPVQIVSVNDDHTFTLNEEALENILKDVKDLPVVVISIAGDMRQGKSFLLSFFIRYLQDMCGGGGEKNSQRPYLDFPGPVTSDWLGDKNLPLKGFSWKGGCEPDTSGILMWSQPFKVQIPSRETVVAVLLMDTQGAFDKNSTVNDCATIFALSTLISSVQIFNIMEDINEDALQNLQLFTDYGNLALKESDQKPFQKLLLLVRDWASKKEYAYGSVGGKKRIDKILEVNAEQHAELCDVRHYIRACFEDISCFLMPHPGQEVTEGDNFEGRIVDIRKDFVEHLCELVQELLAPEKLIVKTIVGQQIKAEKLNQLFKEYLKVFQGGKIPEINTFFKATSDAINLTAVTKAKDLYRSTMESYMEQSSCIEENKLQQFHMDSQSAALKCFQQEPKFGGRDITERWQNTLNQEVEALNNEFIQRNTCRNAIAKSLQCYKNSLDEALNAKYRYSKEDQLKLHEDLKKEQIVFMERLLGDYVDVTTIEKCATRLEEDIEKWYIEEENKIDQLRALKTWSIKNEYDNNPAAWRLAKYFASLNNGDKPFIEEEESSSASTASRVVKSGLSGAAAAKLLPTRFELLYGNLGAYKNVFGIKDMAQVGTKNWVFRIDQPHSTVGFDHLNINIKGAANPAFQLPAGAATAGEYATKTVKALGVIAVVVGAAVDAYSLAKTIYNDMQNNHTLTSQTGKKTATVAAGWAGGLGGAVAGEAGGAAIGGAIGALFGGVGAIPGAAIGGMLGGLAGGIGGGITGPLVAGKIVDAVRGKLNGRLLSHKCGALELKPAFPLENSEKVEEWFKLVLDFIKLVLENREIFVLTWHDAEEVFISEPLDYTIEKLDEMSYFKAKLSTSFLTDACTSPQFSFSEMAFTSPTPNIVDAHKLRGCTKKQVLEGNLNVENDYFCMTSNGSSLLWLKPEMTLGNIKTILKNNNCEMLVE